MITQNTSSTQEQTVIRHKTAAIVNTVTSVPGYPKKLKVYLNNASPYWQASYFDNGSTYRLEYYTSNTDIGEPFSLKFLKKASVIVIASGSQDIVFVEVER